MDVQIRTAQDLERTVLVRMDDHRVPMAGLLRKLGLSTTATHSRDKLAYLWTGRFIKLLLRVLDGLGLEMYVKVKEDWKPTHDMLHARSHAARGIE